MTSREGPAGVGGGPSNDRNDSPTSISTATPGDAEVFVRLASWLADVAAEAASKERAAMTSPIGAEQRGSPHDRRLAS
jgi:hypothetical protein